MDIEIEVIARRVSSSDQVVSKQSVLITLREQDWECLNDHALLERYFLSAIRALRDGARPSTNATLKKR